MHKHDRSHTSISNFSVAPPGMALPAPAFPYPIEGGIIKTTLAPGHRPKAQQQSAIVSHPIAMKCSIPSEEMPVHIETISGLPLTPY